MSQHIESYDLLWARSQTRPRSFENLEINFVVSEALPDPAQLAGDPRLGETRTLRLVEWVQRDLDTADVRASDHAPLLQALLQRRWPRLEELSIEGFGGLDGELLKQVGDLSPLWGAAPGLRRLMVMGSGVRLGTVRAPALERLELHTPRLDEELGRALHGAELPALATLVLGAEEGSWPARLLPPRSSVPHLRALALVGSEWDGTALLDTVLQGDLLGALESLSLVSCRLAPAEVERMVGLASRFAHLQELLLENDCWPDRLCRALKETLPQVSFTQGAPAPAEAPQEGDPPAELDRELSLSRLEAWELSVPTQQALREVGIATVGQLLARSSEELMETGSFRRRSLRELKEILADRGLRLRPR